ncbi:MAG: glycoside hydrolase family 2 protein [Clostridia bacterium]|nr:glycoside hydrolase family 2 protein [Clostridia bacterium]
MERISLNGAWQMRACDDSTWIPAQVPGSVYANLLSAGKMDDPFWRDNELDACRRMEKDYVYRRSFTLSEADLQACDLVLRCEGLDTLAEISLNGSIVGSADNMHRIWEYSILEHVHAGENELSVRFASPIRFIYDANEKLFTDGSTDCMSGFPQLRKAHCMFGWDWGPRLPDAGIWRDISILKLDEARIEDIRIHQEHDGTRVRLDFIPNIKHVKGTPNYALHKTVICPDGRRLSTLQDSIVIDTPELWWPNGYGSQPLYTVEVELICGGRVLDTWTRRIGLRTLTVRNEPDQWGESFEFVVNGVAIFAMGGDYIPEDNLLARVTPERTRRLIEDCALAHHNSIRVWGGGYYPDDWFYDACDELGLIVWQDFMFACGVYELTPAFSKNITAEFVDNIRRLRHHASLGLWCGNNELEWQYGNNDYRISPKQRADYIRLFETLIPSVLEREDPDTFFWPASPSSGGSFDEPNAPNRGDVHYWEVWHSDKPFTAYREHLFRFASEFGFQSFPCLKTVESFTEPKDRNVFSYVMEKHQRNQSANGKIMNYLAQNFRYPNSFDGVLYASQLLQAEAIRYGVEHWRRNRGRCMGAIYWQVNDCWPVASWSSIDYFGRWKALHYASKRFFAPLLISCEEEGTLTQNMNVNAEFPVTRKTARLNIANETTADVQGTVRWALRTPDAAIVLSGSQDVTVPALTSLWLERMDFSAYTLRGHYLSYEFAVSGRVVSSGTVLFCAPKHFEFEDPQLRVAREGDCLRVSAAAYARGVEIICHDGDVLLDDNYFDMNAGEKTVRILRGGQAAAFSVRALYHLDQ